MKDGVCPGCDTRMLEGFDDERRRVGGEPVFPIRRFWEKPASRLASTLLDRGGPEPVRAALGNWSDGGSPHRVIASLARAGRRSSWLDRVRLASTA